MSVIKLEHKDGERSLHVEGNLDELWSLIAHSMKEDQEFTSLLMNGVSARLKDCMYQDEYEYQLAISALNYVFAFLRRQELIPNHQSDN